jgi:hypothetical protein
VPPNRCLTYLSVYITPTGTFTHFHQDGHGSVDSGHQVISGYNEICMLRRLPERHKRHAMWLLTGGGKSEGAFYDALYSEPHGDGLGEKPQWPTKTQIDELRRMGYVTQHMRFRIRSPRASSKVFILSHQVLPELAYPQKRTAHSHQQRSTSRFSENVTQ